MVKTYAFRDSGDGGGALESLWGELQAPEEEFALPPRKISSKKFCGRCLEHARLGLTICRSTE
jgi:hypothetical protein